MAPRSLARANTSSSSTPVPIRVTNALAQPASSTAPQLRDLRRQWKWAAFSQFFHTFAQLIALDDVTLVDIENDLADSTMVVLPRLMQRLLVTLTQDRKISLDNWQTALRKQYIKRSPDANSIGIEVDARYYSRANTSDAESKEEHDNDRENIFASVQDESEKGEPLGCPTSFIPKVEGGGANEHLHPQVYHNNGGLNSLDEDHHRLKDWSELAMLEKLESLHTLAEWHFMNPGRLRSLMHSDDEYASWRIEPIGYDSKKNAYWLIGCMLTLSLVRIIASTFAHALAADRLWVQRPLPSSRKDLKRKSTGNPTARRAKSSWLDGRTRTKSNSLVLATSKVVSDSSKSNASSNRSAVNQRHIKVDEPRALNSSSRARAAKTKANVKLNLQARQLAVAKAEIEALERRASSRSPRKVRIIGTRKSRRLHASESDDDWQQIPPEWLLTGSDLETSPAIKKTVHSARKGWANNKNEHLRTAATCVEVLESDESDLTELSDDETLSNQDSGLQEEHSNNSTSLVDPCNREPTEFIEWETICVSLQEWESVAEPFSQVTNYLERALYKTLVREIVPKVAGILHDLEKQRLQEEALMNRKRSSRLAIKESEKEAVRLAAEMRAEEEEKLARRRRLQARERREEDERLTREREREKRRLEREERERTRSRRNEEGTKVEQDFPAREMTDTVQRSGKKSSVRYGKPCDDWELGCEICGAKGINKDDGLPLMCCGICGVWQHIPCHDEVDKRAGRALRKWESVEFTCRKCNSLVKPGDNGDLTSITCYTNSQQEQVLYPTFHFVPTGTMHPSLNSHYSSQLKSPQLVKTSSSSKDASHTSRFAYYQPTERSYAQHPASIQNLINPQPEILQHRTAPSPWKVNHPDLSQQPNNTPPYVPFAYPKVTNTYVSYPANQQQRSYLPQTTPHLANQSFYHPQA